MFYKDSDRFYRVPELDAFEWLVHGFGTRAAQPPARLATLKQIHSATCVAAEGRTGQIGQGDALIETAPGSAVAVKTADCIPILLADARHRAVAAVHAGWRGTASRIAAAAVAAMHDRFGSEPRDIHAAIGPGIGECCYEVGPEVAAHFGKQGRVRLDLAGANRNQLRQAGVENIYLADLCTMCNAEEFHSYRRDKEAAGRLHSFIGIR